MKNTFGHSVSVTIFGESHGTYIGAVIDGIAPGISIDEDFITDRLSMRRPSGRISTARREADNFSIVSGVFDGKTTGTPLCIIIPNSDTHSRDYAATKDLARPGHADYAAHCKYHGYEDYRGGGHFSGRITAALVAAGAIAISALEGKGIYIGTHVKRCAGINDREFNGSDMLTDIRNLKNKTFAVLDDSAEPAMRSEIEKAAADGDSVGGILETAIVGVPSGVGEPWFDSLESVLSHMLFSIPAVKGVQFGAGFAMADSRGSEMNDPLRTASGKVTTETNNNGGINGGISNGMPIIFSLAVKPTPSIYKKQRTINMASGENADLVINGRHDPAIVHRARVVADSAAALALCDMLAMRFGTDWLAVNNQKITK